VDESQVFLAAVKLAPMADRVAYLDAACAGNPRLRAGVEALLRAHDTAPSFLEDPVAVTGDLPRGAAADEPAPGPTDRADAGLVLADRYELLEPIGEGGMGTVWLARQAEPVTRTVAVKLIKPGMDSKQVLARFEAERQALALMDHPNIARVFDAGATPDGRPFFVMELVKGSPITAYCDERKLTPRQRLELFVPVCQAIQHAHQKGVIHRDVKPSNVLVTLYDDKPVPKVIDFGVAKAVGQSLTDQTLATGLGVVGTPEYMSPEQASFHNADVDTRSDVYALGVLLYELLTGSPPFSRKDLAKPGLLEILRVIREDEPPRPSTRLSTADGLPSLAANRGTEPRKLCGQVRGELDWIVMKALEKDRNRRYDTAVGLAADVRHYLADEPVRACPPSAAYRLRKFVRRHRGPVLATAALLLALLGGIVGTAWQAAQANRERLAVIHERDEKQKALDAESAARKQAMDALRTMTDEFVISRLGRQAALSEADRAVLVKMVAHFEAFAALQGDAPESRAIRAEGHYRVGVLRHRLGDRAEALAAYGRAGELYQQLAGEFPGVPAYRGLLASNQNNLALLLQDLGKAEEAEATLRRAIELTTPDAYPAPEEYRWNLAARHNNLATLLDARKQFPAAEAEYRRALALHQQLVDESRESPVYRWGLAVAHRNLGLFLWQLRRPEAVDEYHRAIDLLAPLVERFPRTPEYRWDLALDHADLGLAFQHQGKRVGADAEFRLALTALKRLVADFPGVPDYRRSLATYHHNLAILLEELGKPSEAGAEYRRAIALRKQLADDFPDVPHYCRDLASSHMNLGHLLAPLSKDGEAEAEFRRAIALLKSLADGSHPPDYRRSLATAHGGLGFVLLKLRKYPEAEPEYRSALTILKSLADEYPGVVEYTVELGGAYSNRATFLRDTGKPDEALGLYKQAIDTLVPVVNHDPQQITARKYLAITCAGQAQALDQLRRHTDAKSAYRRATDLDRQLADEFPEVPEYRKRLADTHSQLASLLNRLGEKEPAVAEFRTSIALLERLVEEFPTATNYRVKLGWCHNELAAVLPKASEAAAELRRSIAVRKRLADDFPDEPEYRADLSDTHSNLGTVLSGLGSDAAAETDYRTALAIQKALVEKLPTVPRYRGVLARRHNSLGLVLLKLRKPEAAETEFRAALAVQKQLVADFPDVPVYAVDLAGTSCNFGNMVRARNAEEALNWYRQAVQLLTPLAERQPPPANARPYLRNSHWGRAVTLQGLKRFADAVPDWDRALELDDGRLRNEFKVQRAWCLAHVDPSAAVTAVEQLVKDGDLPAQWVYGAAGVTAAASQRAKDRTEGDKHAARAVELLHRARDGGYFKDKTRISGFKRDPAFDPLREREDFKKLLLELDEPQK
jgi:serine/threonine protein kinase/tetratricopeptide (TPR) repeat protein